MKIECTVEELKKILKNEQTECRSDCSKVNVLIGNEEFKCLENHD